MKHYRLKDYKLDPPDESNYICQECGEEIEPEDMILCVWCGVYYCEECCRNDESDTILRCPECGEII